MTIEGHEFQNFKNVSLKWASLTQATEQSLNTPYLQLNQELMNADDIEEGVTAKVANRAGYPEQTEGLKTPEQRTLIQNVLGSPRRTRSTSPRPTPPSPRRASGVTPTSWPP